MGRQSHPAVRAVGTPPRERPLSASRQRREERQRRRHRARQLRVTLVATLSAAVLAGAVVLALNAGSSSAGYNTTSAGWVLPRLGSSGSVSLASLRGRPLVVNFFASWCYYCGVELPTFAQDASALKGQVDVVEVNALETGNGYAFAQRFSLQTKATALLHDVGGSNGDGLYRSLGGDNSLPLTAFYNAKGQLLWTHIGAYSATSLAAALRQYYGVHVS